MAEVIAKSYEDQVANCDSVFKGILTLIEKQQLRYDINEDLLKRAYETAKEKHKAQTRNSGEIYLVHPLAVAESLTKLHANTSVLAAALLHDTMEDCDYSYEDIRKDFSSKIADIVYAVTALRKEERSADPVFVSMNDKEKHDFLDRLTDARLVNSKYQREAFLVRFADREHNLSTIGKCKLAKRRLKAEQTKAFLIPAAERLGVHYFQIVLSDLCYKLELVDYEPDDEFAENEGSKKAPIDPVTSVRTDLITIGRDAVLTFEEHFRDAIASQSFFRYPPFNPLSRQRGKRQDGSGLEIQFRRILRPYEIAKQVEFDIAAITRQNVCTSEILLIYPGDGIEVAPAQFIQMFRRSLQPKGSFLTCDSSLDLTSTKGGVSFVITDEYENNYRVLLLPEDKLTDYFIGNLSGELLTMSGDESVGDAVREKITVYSYSDYAGVREYKKQLPKGATSLDFAFLIKPELALTVTDVQIKRYIKGREVLFDEYDYAYPKKTVLNDGDIVHFLTEYSRDNKSPTPRASLDWFEYINTELATHCLVEYFKRVVTP